MEQWVGQRWQQFRLRRLVPRIDVQVILFERTHPDDVLDSQVQHQK